MAVTAMRMATMNAKPPTASHSVRTQSKSPIHSCVLPCGDLANGVPNTEMTNRRPGKRESK